MKTIDILKNNLDVLKKQLNSINMHQLLHISLDISKKVIFVALALNILNLFV